MKITPFFIGIVKKFPKGSIWQTRYVCLPFVLIVATAAFVASSLPLPERCFYLTLGAASWTFLEYVFHRWILHFTPRGFIGRALLERLHIFHHERPEDQSQVCLPFLFTAPQWAVIFGIIVACGGNHSGGLLFTAGLAAMMVIYDIAHFSAHYMPATNALLRRLKSHHLKHHFSDHATRFGVTSPFWDFVFRTTGR